jgi:hypothetical protein
VEWVNVKEKLPEENFAVEVELHTGEITWDVLLFKNSQWVWERHQGNIRRWRYATRTDYIMAQKQKLEREQKQWKLK